MAKNNVVQLHAERWVNEVYKHEGLTVDISSKGQVRFNVYDGDDWQSQVLPMVEVLNLGKILSIAFGADEEELEERLRNVERDPSQ